MIQKIYEGAISLKYGQKNQFGIQFRIIETTQNLYGLLYEIFKRNICIF